MHHEPAELGIAAEAYHAVVSHGGTDLLDGHVLTTQGCMPVLDRPPAGAYRRSSNRRRSTAGVPGAHVRIAAPTCASPGLGTGLRAGLRRNRTWDGDFALHVRLAVTKVGQREGGIGAEAVRAGMGELEAVRAGWASWPSSATPS